MTQTDKMLSRKEGGVGIVTFNNPERHNAVSLDMWEATKRILDDFAADEEVRVVVLTGAGGKAFVSGADISKFASERASLEDTRTYNIKTEAAFVGIYEFPKPTIAMIRGYCIGGGLGLATCCDLRICSDNSRFAVPAAKLGLGYSYAGLRRLTDVVGPAFAREIFFTARQFDTEEAKAMGLINRVVPQVEHLGMAQPVKTRDKSKLRMAGQPMSLSRTPSKLVAPPPKLGEHTDAVLKEFGFSANEIAALRKANAV